MNNQRKILMAGAALVIVAGGAYGVARVFPARGGETAGTITPAERYRSSQISNADVALGDTTVPQLMQTDAFELMVKNPSFRALAQDPGFVALAQNREVMAALTQNPEAFAALARDPEALVALAANAQEFSEAAAAAGSKGDARAVAELVRDAEGFRAFRQGLSADAVKAMSEHPEAMLAMAEHPRAFEAMANNPKAVAALAEHGQTIAALSREPAFVSLTTHAAFGNIVNSPAWARRFSGFSDGRLKQDVRTVGYDSKGRRWVDFAYIWEPGVTRRGVIAQEVRAIDPDAVFEDESGFLMVDYSKLD